MDEYGIRFAQNKPDRDVRVGVASCGQRLMEGGFIFRRVVDSSGALIA
jgi:hypothetical protein